MATERPPQASSYAERRRKGRCVDCGRPAPRGRCRCAVHAAESRVRGKKQRTEMRATGKCQRCRKRPAVRGGVCDGCRKRVKALPSTGRNVTHERREAQWRCKACDEPMPSDMFKSCARCRADAAEATQAHREAMAAKGLCRCGRKLAKNPAVRVDSLGRRCHRKLPKFSTRCAICRNRKRKGDRTSDPKTTKTPA